MRSPNCGRKRDRHLWSGYARKMKCECPKTKNALLAVLAKAPDELDDGRGASVARVREMVGQWLTKVSFAPNDGAQPRISPPTCRIVSRLRCMKITVSV